MRGRRKKKKNVYRILAGKPEGKIPIGRHNVAGRIILNGY
jgi:hypothetical protein